MRHTIINRARFWGNHYQAKIQDMQQRSTSSTCMMSSPLIGRDAKVYKQERQLVANDSIWEQLSSPFLQKQAIVFQTAAADP